MYTKITIIKKIIFCIKYIIMVKITKNKLRLTAENRGIKDYQNMSNKKLLRTLYKLKRIAENLSNIGLNKILKIENL